MRVKCYPLERKRFFFFDNKALLNSGNEIAFALFLFHHKYQYMREER